VKRAWLFGTWARGEAGGSVFRFFSGLVKIAGFANFMGLKCALEDALGARVDLPLRSTDTRSVASREKGPVAIRGHKVRGVAMQPQSVRFWRGLRRSWSMCIERVFGGKLRRMPAPRTANWLELYQTLKGFRF
jgi:hypothetical protein